MILVSVAAVKSSLKEEPSNGDEYDKILQGLEDDFDKDIKDMDQDLDEVLEEIEGMISEEDL